MNATHPPRQDFTVEPIRRPVIEDAQLAQVCQAIGWPPDPSPPLEVTGWRLTLTVDGQPVEQRTFEGAQEGFEQARRDGCQWLAQHGQDSIDQWMANWSQASRRMQWDHRYANALSQRGF